eukprot:TRINITY_DN9858_c0_g1_i2.p1 TRINITY_DN9858_c0_g1~~TRINITY_DN9858_c0_g1_i2.p1  ORF type:complete len:341 (-),score=37.37 TRINITY_DN9858_c0_g1_i2:38-1033(-)
MASFSSKSMAVFSLLVVMFCLCFVSSFADLPKLEHPIKEDGSLNVLVVGDWGRKGTHNQTKVAFQMGKIGDELDINFVISTGDNFYDNGLTGVIDPAFDESFADIYTFNSLQTPWYAVLGNHDYRGDVIAQLSPELHKIDKRWICMRSYILDAETSQFFFVDTTPFQLKYWFEPEDDTYDWRGVAPRDKYIANLLKDLGSALAESTAKWKIVIGHHTIRSAGTHGDTQELKELLLPVLKANDVDLYINGHDHCLQHISSLDSPIQFLTSGGGSKAWKGEFDTNIDGMRFYYDGQGFMSLQLTNTEAKVVFYDIYGKVLHQWGTSKHHYAIV